MNPLLLLVLGLAGLAASAHGHETVPHAQLERVADPAVRSMLEGVLTRERVMRADLERADLERTQMRTRIAALEQNLSDERLARQEESERLRRQAETLHVKCESTATTATTNRSRKQVDSECTDADLDARSEAAMEACCPTGSEDGHRRAQAQCSLPDACPSVTCADVFVAFLGDCRHTILANGMPVSDLDGFSTQCQELQAQESALGLQPVTVQMFKVQIATGAAPEPVSVPEPSPEPVACTDALESSYGPGACAQFLVSGTCDSFAADSLNQAFAGGCDLTCGFCGGGQPAPEPSSSTGSSAVQEYHAVCSSATIADCIPTCNATHHGYVLLATIDGTDTKFSCNVAHGLYSWVGAASEGGYLGVDFQAFFSAVSSGAAGNYLVTMIAAAGISTALTIRAGQIVSINGGGSGKGERKFTTAAAAAPPPPSLLRRHPYNNSNNNIRHTGHT